MESGFMPMTVVFRHLDLRIGALHHIKSAVTRRFVAIVLFFSVASNAVAYLWETEAEIEKRYGACVRKVDNDPVFGNLSVYHFGEYEIRVTFIDGKSQSEFYVRRDQKTPLTSNDINFLLEVNSFGRNWTKSADLALWRLGNSEAFAIYRNEGPGGLGICTAKFLESQHKERTPAISGGE